MRFTHLILVPFVVSCTVQYRAPNGDEIAAVKAAETFIERHGYTAAGHPPNWPVEVAEVLDPLSTPEELVKDRKGQLENNAFGVARVHNDSWSPKDAYYVYFHTLGDAAGFRAVLVQEGKAVQVVHSKLELDWFPWVRVR
jgi:hypothetical protein